VRVGTTGGCANMTTPEGDYGGTPTTTHMYPVPSRFMSALSVGAESGPGKGREKALDTRTSGPVARDLPPSPTSTEVNPGLGEDDGVDPRVATLRKHVACLEESTQADWTLAMTEDRGALLLALAAANVADLNLVLADALASAWVRLALRDLLTPACRDGLLHAILLHNNSMALWTYLSVFAFSHDDAAWALTTAASATSRACVRMLMQSSVVPDTAKVPAMEMVHLYVPASLLRHVLTTSTIPMGRIAALTVTRTALTLLQAELALCVIEREGLTHQDLFPNLENAELGAEDRLGNLFNVIYTNNAILFNSLMRKADVPYVSIMYDVAVRYRANGVIRACRQLEDARRTRVVRSAAAPPPPGEVRATKRPLRTIFAGVSL
jgi:hypothetical protein